MHVNASSHTLAHTCMNTLTLEHTHAHPHPLQTTHTHMHTRTHMHANTPFPSHTREYIHLSTQVHTCLHAIIHSSARTHTHTHTHQGLPVGTKGWLGSSACVASLIWMQPYGHVDSMRLAVFLHVRVRQRAKSSQAQREQVSMN